MVSRPRLLTVIFDEGVQTKGADIRSNHDDFTRVIRLHPGHECLHLSADLLGEGLSGLQVSYIPNRVLKKNPTVAIRETLFDWHCAEGAVFGIVRPPPVVVGGRCLPEEVDVHDATESVVEDPDRLCHVTLRKRCLSNGGRL